MDNESDSDDFDEFYNDQSFLNTGLGQGMNNSKPGGQRENITQNFEGQGATDMNYLNRNMSQSQLAAAANAADVEVNEGKEVELKAQGENSQLFQDSMQ
mmetsp:Transcript_2043/g.3056  ORF Transcript_2043/g.3056 Transcript_2043/m.3056 type:complete len:99 (-) Transcript_2043:1660-1956(-)|eukprot:CAMPEP_0170501244 /NCGR_PEP_ID=MMETSP0208-20121228/37666_1 /TAXON_ID=197538 /ORGANISM="Strombidium inclinatum, Strain S3" /LENGTH=98 /DNA_ID=CAMNT_0010779681 /DNA_START=306 /DNA_END=602 /DNA_ORIENTATION=+